MRFRAVPLLNILSAAAAAVTLVSCGPEPPKPGTPTFNWLAAQDAHKKGDFVKANDLLVQVAKTDSEYAVKARPWAMITSQALTKAYYELGEEYSKAANKARRDPAAFRRLVNNYRSKATASGMAYAEVAKKLLEANKDQEVTLAFEMPEAKLNEDPPQYEKIETGVMIPEPDIAQAERFVIRREIVAAVCLAMNTPKDAEKAKAAYQQGEAKVAGPVFLWAAAQTLYDIGEMFGPKKLFQPDRVRSYIYETALQALNYVKEGKEAPALKKKIGESVKKLNP